MELKIIRSEIMRITHAMIGSLGMGYAVGHSVFFFVDVFLLLADKIINLNGDKVNEPGVILAQLTC